MITSLHMKRWKSHEDTRMHFGKGSNLFIGKMGSGKSSAIDAISFALFGTFPSLKSRKLKIEELVMQRPRKHATAEIELEFDVDGKKYKVVRNISPKGTAAQLFEEGKLLEAQTSRVSELVEGFLKLDYELFSRIIYAEQNRIDYLLTLQKGERKRQIDELLGISRFETVRANAGTAINKLYSEKAENEKYLEGAGVEGLKAENAELKDFSEKAREEISAKQHELSNIHLALRELNEKYAGLETLEGEHLRIGREITASEALLKEKTRELEAEEKAQSKESAGSLKMALEGLEKALLEKTLALKEASGEHSQLLGKTEVLRRELPRAEKREAERKRLLHMQTAAAGQAGLHTAVEGAEKAQMAAREAAAASEAQLLELEKALSALHGAGAKCPVCEAELPENRKTQLQDQRRAHKDRLEREALQHKADASHWRQKLEIARKAELEGREIAIKLAELEGAEAELLDAKEGISSIEGIEPELKRRAEGLSKEVDALQKELNEKGGALQRMERIPRLAGEIRGLKAGLAALIEKSEKLKFKQGDMEIMRSEILKSERDGAALNAQIAGLADAQAGRSKQLGEIEAKLSDIAKTESRIASISSKAITLAGFQEAVVETQSLMRGQLIEAMNEAMNMLWRAIYPYGDYTKVKLSPTDDEYEVQLQTGDESWIGVENCSGGEKSCAALTLRVAFAMVLTPGLSWLILDEPTHNLDSQAVQMLNRALHDEIPKIVEQTFIVTHDDALKEGASAKIFYFERDKENGERSIVEELGME